jgi:hypothetical protein
LTPSTPSTPSILCRGTFLRHNKIEFGGFQVSGRTLPNPPAHGKKNGNFAQNLHRIMNDDEDGWWTMEKAGEQAGELFSGE